MQSCYRVIVATRFNDIACSPATEMARFRKRIRRYLRNYLCRNNSGVRANVFGCGKVSYGNAGSIGDEHDEFFRLGSSRLIGRGSHVPSARRDNFIAQKG